MKKTKERNEIETNGKWNEINVLNHRKIARERKRKERKKGENGTRVTKMAMFNKR